MVGESPAIRFVLKFCMERDSPVSAATFRLLTGLAMGKEVVCSSTLWLRNLKLGVSLRLIGGVNVSRTSIFGGAITGVEHFAPSRGLLEAAAAGDAVGEMFSRDALARPSSEALAACTVSRGAWHVHKSACSCNSASSSR